ncbi:hypothetical protein MB27_38245 [Actinoplanes utahensis]|uniref:Pyrrolo-quinoline quinone repeat domain-containing protein n=2 Tax=Actinoplanes utahensis TaxID=1869 RepID=A0A0A6U8H6_ACTUT|nr:hypothetical protein MB27_38245 [Actinoplanes utahensis]
MLLTLALTCAAAPTPAVAAVAPLWDHPGYDAEDSHYNPRETVINGGSVRRLTQKWQATLRTNESCTGFSAPVLAGGRVHVSDQLGVSAQAADNGKTLWRYGWDDPTDTETPRLAVADGLVIVAGGDCNSQSDPDGSLLALDARTGLPRWKQRLDRPVHSVVVDKNVIVVSGGSPSDEDGITAYAVRDGRALWSRAKALTSEVSADGTILARATDGSGIITGTSLALSITDGRQRWERRAGWTARAADASRFYVTDKSGVLSAVGVTDGASGWTATGTGNELIAVDGRRVYRVNGKNIEALDARTGKRVWAVAQKADGRQPVLAGGLLYPGGPVLNATDGTVAGPAFTGDLLVAGGRIHQVTDGVLTTYGPSV